LTLQDHREEKACKGPFEGKTPKKRQAVDSKHLLYTSTRDKGLRVVGWGKKKSQKTTEKGRRSDGGAKKKLTAQSKGQVVIGHSENSEWKAKELTNYRSSKTSGKKRQGGEKNVRKDKN